MMVPIERIARWLHGERPPKPCLWCRTPTTRRPRYCSDECDTAAANSYAW